MTDPTPLSPAAQAVMDAFVSNAGEGHRHQSAAVAAALRAVVDQVAPEDYAPPTKHDEFARGMFAGKTSMNIDIRAALCRIAAELGNNQ